MTICLLLHGELERRAAELHPTVDDFRRAARFATPLDRARSLLTAELLRRAVTGLTGEQGADVVRWCRTCGRDGDHGRPVVRSGPARGVHLSASHAGDVVVVVGSTRSPVGVDVELVRLVTFPGFDDLALTPAERATLGPDPDEARARLWTRKEAVLKWTGRGLTVEPSHLEFDGDGRPYSRSPDLARELSSSLRTRDLPGLPAGHVGSVAADEGVAFDLTRARGGG